jgi:hypothetical protein
MNGRRRRAGAIWRRWRGLFCGVLITFFLVEGMITDNAMHVALGAGVLAAEAHRKIREIGQ